MARPCKKRRICGKPICNCFTPQEAGSYESVVMNLDEYECIRLIDYEGLEQEQCSEQMGVSRATVQAIYKYEAGRNYPQTDVMFALLELYEADFRELICEQLSHCSFSREGCWILYAAVGKQPELSLEVMVG